MPVTQQSQAIQTANELISIAGQLMNVYQQMIVIDAYWNDNGVATCLGTMGTVALNTDGSLGGADPQPNPAHPLNPATYTSLSRAISSNQIGQIKTILDGIVNYVGGQAVTTQAGAHAILNVAIGG